MAKKEDDRVARKKPEEHKNLDVMVPFKYKDLGSENDPCFGKLYSIKAKECKVCGDCEACAVVTSQKGFIAGIIEQNNKQPFLDIQEGELVDKQNEELLTLMEKRVKKKKDKEFSVKVLAIKMQAKWNLVEADLEYIRQRIILMAGKSKIITLSKDKKKYEYKEN